MGGSASASARARDGGGARGDARIRAETGRGWRNRSHQALVRGRTLATEAERAATLRAETRATGAATRRADTVTAAILGESERVLFRVTRGRGEGAHSRSEAATSVTHKNERRRDKENTHSLSPPHFSETTIAVRKRIDQRQPSFHGSTHSLDCQLSPHFRPRQPPVIRSRTTHAGVSSFHASFRSGAVDRSSTSAPRRAPGLAVSSFPPSSSSRFRSIAFERVKSSRVTKKT